jgi:hypothetical protein
MPRAPYAWSCGSRGWLFSWLACGPMREWGVSRTTFALFFLVPDLSWLGYLLGPRVGAATCNSAHSYIGALGCLTLGVLQSRPIALAAGIIWCTHVGLDRALGYGLKYSTGFQYTHLGRIGRRPQSMSPSPTGSDPVPM